MPRHHFIAIAGACVLASCGGAAEPVAPATTLEAGNGALTTDATEYTARVVGTAFGNNIYEFTVVTRYHNATSSVVYLARCYPDSRSPTYGVQSVAQGDPHRAAYDPVWACVGHDRQIAVAPGATRTDTLAIRGPNAFDGFTHAAFGTTDGRFRISFVAQGCVGDGACALPDEALRLSNEFAVRLEP